MGMGTEGNDNGGQGTGDRDSGYESFLWLLISDFEAKDERLAIDFFDCANECAGGRPGTASSSVLLRAEFADDCN